MSGIEWLLDCRILNEKETQRSTVTPRQSVTMTA